METEKKTKVKLYGAWFLEIIIKIQYYIKLN